MARRSFGRRQFRPRVKRNYKWLRTQVNATGITANNTSTTILMETIDYNDTTLSPTGVTMWRFIFDGYIGINVTPGVAGESAVEWGVLVSDEDHAPVSIDATSIVNERWLALGVAQIQLATPSGQVLAVPIKVDTKVRVALKDTTVKLIVFNRAAAANNVLCRGIASMLLVGDTS